MRNYAELRAFLSGSVFKWRDSRNIGNILLRSGASAERRRLKKRGEVSGGLPTRRYERMAVIWQFLSARPRSQAF